MLTHPLAVMNELLFECYSVPRVAYGVDALFGLNSNLNEEWRTHLVVSLGFHTVHVIPVVDGVVREAIQ